MQQRIGFDNVRFKEIIGANHKNKQKISQQLKIPVTQLEQWLNGKSIPSKTYINKINDLVGVDLSYKSNLTKRERKYNNQKPVVDGITFDSLKEANRYCELRSLQKIGEISNLRRQVKYVLIPSQKDENGHCVERECAYKADFVYEKDSQIIVEDTKGVRTSDYVIKRKLMLFIHHIKIREI